MTSTSENTLLAEKIRSISKKELENLVLKAARKSKEFDAYLRINYLDKKQTEMAIFETAQKDINQLMRKNYKGFSHELQLANMLSACNKRVNEFSKLCKNKKAEVDLLMLVLEIPFQYAPAGSIGTCFTVYDYKISLILKKIITIIKTKLHSDYKTEYSDKINLYLLTMHNCSNHNDFIYSLPKSI